MRISNLFDAQRIHDELRSDNDNELSIEYISIAKWATVNDIFLF